MQDRFFIWHVLFIFVVQSLVIFIKVNIYKLEYRWHPFCSHFHLGFNPIKRFLLINASFIYAKLVSSVTVTTRKRVKTKFGRIGPWLFPTHFFRFGINLTIKYYYLIPSTWRRSVTLFVNIPPFVSASMRLGPNPGDRIAQRWSRVRVRDQWKSEQRGRRQEHFPRRSCW